MFCELEGWPSGYGVVNFSAVSTNQLLTNNLQRPELSLKVAHNKSQTFYIEEVGERGCL